MYLMFDFEYLILNVHITINIVARMQIYIKFRIPSQITFSIYFVLQCIIIIAQMLLVLHEISHENFYQVILEPG